MSGFAPQAVAIPLELKFASAAIPSKPQCEIRTAQVVSKLPPDTPQPFIVFLNGLMLPQSGWHPAISYFIQNCKATGQGWPAMLTYDRFGQGQTIARDPLDAGKEPYGHDTMDVVRDLHELIQTLEPKLSGRVKSSKPRPLLFVANSIGCAIARLYAQEYPGSVTCLIFLDSIMADSDFVDSIWPQPDNPEFDPARDLPKDVTLQDLLDVREKYRKMLHPSVPSAEGLDRRNLATLLPYAHKPHLKGLDGKDGPTVIVIGHDPDKFAADSYRDLGTPVSLTNRYANKIWHQYNVDLTKITTQGRSSGPLTAKHCGHFIQRDDPQLVANLLHERLKDVIVQ